MAKWKLTRITNDEKYSLVEGQKVTVGRGIDNTITFPSLMISRHHCVIEVFKDNLSITDLKSSNGTYVGNKKITQHVPYKARESDTIGFGWADGVMLQTVDIKDRFVFTVTKEDCIINSLTFQSDNESDDLEEQINFFRNNIKPLTKEVQSATIEGKPNLKRKLSANSDSTHVKIKKEVCDKSNNNQNHIKDDDIITLLSDSDDELHQKNSNNNNKEHNILKPICKDLAKIKEAVKIENYKNLEYDEFNIKQEYLDYDDELITVDSDSDSESEQWLIRLSQNSPGKPFTKIKRESYPEVHQEDSSYSQMDDLIIEPLLASIDIDDQVEEEMDDIISLPPQNTHDENNIIDDGEYLSDFVLSTNQNETDGTKTTEVNNKEIEKDVTDSTSSKASANVERFFVSPIVTEPTKLCDDIKKIQIIEPPPKDKSTRHQSKTKSTSKKSKSKNDTVSKKHLTDSQKEERKKKLKEIANKGKDYNQTDLRDCTSATTSKSTVNAKVTCANRGAFLTEAEQTIVKAKRKTSPVISVKDATNNNMMGEVSLEQQIEIEINKSHRDEKKRKAHKSSKKKDKHKCNKNTLSDTIIHNSLDTNLSDVRIPLTSLKPLSQRENSLSTKPSSKVEPLPPIKKVHFSDKPPQVRVFQIEPGNKMVKTSLVKSSLADKRPMPVYSLEKITLMKILRWNPPWLEEQMKVPDPPPILGPNISPMALLHYYKDHGQYIQLFGNLILMEIWECLTQSYMKERTQDFGIKMTIESLPQVPTQERCIELFNFNVTVSLPKLVQNQRGDHKNLPRVGEILYVMFGPENAKITRFFFVHNVRCIPSTSSPQTIFNLSLYATFTEKMSLLRPGEVMLAKKLSHINNELMLFEAMDHLVGSPLSEAILRPKSNHFTKIIPEQLPNMRSKWTATMNESQMVAVSSSVAAALSDQPSIQMVQGPPGTGKSSVICAIVMSYFYEPSGKKHQNRGKILICATSNPAVDELVIRLLNIRQSLPKSERFRMVRVGRAEAMHPRALDMSSQELAKRDAQRLQVDSKDPSLGEEILLLEAKINMCMAAIRDAKDPGRAAYYETKRTQLIKRIALIRSGGGQGASGGASEGLRPEQLAAAERRIVEGADIIVTTLSSAHNHKMKGLKRRIALCIVDEAGQATEPETLIPLTLGVTRLTLVGDPQQLTGFICSQRAKNYGLGESLFARLTSCSEQWTEGSPVVLLNQQYRMHQHIAHYPNTAFYNNMIKTCASPRPDLPVPPYAILDISSGNRGQTSSGANEMEAWGVSRVVIALHSLCRAKQLSLAVITPYRAQKDVIKKYLRILLGPVGESGVEVNTVDSFQGQERDVVVVSLARSHGVGFLTDAGRMNVMLTRAKHALLVCLNSHALMKNYQWRTLVDDAKKRNVFRFLPHKMCQPMTQANIGGDNILRYIIKP